MTVRYRGGNPSKVDHSYEEMRNQAMHILAKPRTQGWQYIDLRDELAATFAERERGGARQHGEAYDRLSPNDTMTFLALFWDLFRQGITSLGTDDCNANFPFFHVTELGKKIL